MRTLKFRAWDGDKMWNVQELRFVGAKAVTLQFNPVVRKRLIDVYVMQYTGLKDQSGKEIWEGDIVKYMGDGSHQTVKAIEWRDNYAYSGWNIGSGKVMRWEAIGNIYETPNLIEREQ